MAMKAIFLILTVFCSFSFVTAQREKSIFEYGETEVITKSEYMTPFYFDYQGVSSYLFKSFTISSEDNKYSYIVKLSNYEGTENDGGFYRIIDIEYENKNILNLKQSDGWDKLKERIRPYASNDYFLAIPLTRTSTALIFVGYPYNSQPELLTIVVLNKDKAMLVFNKEIMVNKIEYDKVSSSFVMNLQDYPIEYLDETTPANAAKLFKIFLESGVLKFGGPYGTVMK